MTKNKRDKEFKPKKSSNSFKSFLKKRAPIYLALIALFMIFVIPELTKSDLKSSLPKVTPEEQQIIDIIMNYNGPDKSGLTIMDAISMMINDEYPNEKIFDHRKTNVDLVLNNVNQDVYQIILNFKSYKGEMNYDWNVNVNSKNITPNNSDSKHIIDIVNFYD